MSIAQWVRKNTDSNAGRNAYLLALVFPLVSFLSWTSIPYPLYRVEEWIELALVPVCLIQYFKPTLVGWGVVLLWYAWSVLEQIQRHIEVFQDKGSGDHGSWEGWDMELIFLAFTVWFLAVVILVAINYPRRLVNAT